MASEPLPKGGLEGSEIRTMRQARMLDLRSYIGALFLIFGLVVTISGLRASPAELAKAQGININLWAGIAMLALSGVFIVWAILTPPDVPGRVSEAQLDTHS